MLIDGLDAAKSILPTNKQVYLAIGFFDGVHLGHQALIGKAIDIAKETDGISAVLTFWPHPSKVFGHEVKLLMTREEKHSKLKRLGVDYIIE